MIVDHRFFKNVMPIFFGEIEQFIGLCSAHFVIEAFPARQLVVRSQGHSNCKLCTIALTNILEVISQGIMISVLDSSSRRKTQSISYSSLSLVSGTFRYLPCTTSSIISNYLRDTFVHPVDLLDSIMWRISTEYFVS